MILYASIYYAKHKCLKFFHKEDKLMADKKNNAKCPNCGAELYVGLEKGTALCTFCKKQFDAEKAVKLYKTLNAQTEEDEKKVAKGSDYIEVEHILERAEFYFSKKQFEKAKKELESALELTTTDYRVYFGLVRVETKNLTDYRNKTHEQYLDKAIECADMDGKSVITRLYKDFYQLSKCTDAEIEQYKTEENAAIKSKLESKLKDLIPSYMKKESSLKKYPFIFAAAYAVAVIVFILGFVLQYELMFLGAVVLLAIGYINTRAYFDGKNSVALFNALLDVYDKLADFSLSVGCMRNILDCMKNCRAVFAEKNSLREQEQNMSLLVDALEKSNNAQVDSFVKEHKILSKYINNYQNEE